MNDSPKAIKENAVEASPKLPQVITNFSGYLPPFDPVPIIERMLASVPPKYLVGLKEVVLTNSGGMSRKLRRSVTKARKRKVRVVETRGLYHPAWRSGRAWIEIFVDNTLKPWGRAWWLRLPYSREMMLGGVLFHEIGHHIHFATRPEYREKEDVADDWMRKLRRSYFLTQHPGSRIIFFALRPLLQVIVWFLKREPAT